MKKIKRIAIFGGVHGNELLGIYLVKKFQQFPQLITRNSLEVITLLANPQAIAKGRRYIDTDLNRCFSQQDLFDIDRLQYEPILARKIIRQIKDLEIDFLIDIHTSTANMGITLLLSNLLPFNLNLVAYLIAINPNIKVVYSQNNDNNRLRHVCQFGFTIEVGAIAHGVLDPIWFQKTEQLVNQILDYLDIVHSDKVAVTNNNLTVYSSLVPVKYPLDRHQQISAMIHPTLQGQDYCELHPGSPLFLNFDDSEILYRGEATVYPIFINESAYWEHHIAMYLTTKQQITPNVN